MPPSSRVLVVDDSVVVRKVVSDVLGADPWFDVVGSAPNGKVALQKIDQLHPDLVVLDVEMPVMDGLATLREIKRLSPEVRVVMFSSFTTAGAKVTVDALTFGAEDYATKPSEGMSSDAARAAVAETLVPKLKALTRPRAASGLLPAPAAAPRRRRPVGATEGIDVVAIGASTGGPNALALLFARLPANLPVPIVVVQHMPPVFTKHFAERLTRESNVPVVEGADGDRVLPGHAYLAPGGRHMTVERVGAGAVLALDDGPPVHSCRPAADVLFASVERTFRARTLVVVMTGMGEDGLAGARVLAAVGARVLVQDRGSSVVWGMAGAVAGAGLADLELSPTELGDEIVRRARVGRS